MIQRKDKVTHPVHGVGIVEGFKNNESIAKVDFKGTMHECEVSNLTKGANTYRPKKSGEEMLQAVLLEIEDLEKQYGVGMFSDGARNALNNLKNRLQP